MLWIFCNYEDTSIAKKIEVPAITASNNKENFDAIYIMNYLLQRKQ